MKGSIETIRTLLCSVADPGLSRRGGRGGSANSKGGGTNPLFGQIFLENCMKIGGRGPACPLDLPTIIQMKLENWGQNWPKKVVCEFLYSINNNSQIR